MVPGGDEPLAGDLEAGEGASVGSAVGDKVVVLVGLQPVAFVNPVLSRHSQLKDVDNFALLLNHNHIRSEIGDTYFWWNSTTTSCLVSSQITVNFEPCCVHAGQDAGQDGVMTPREPFGVEGHTAPIEDICALMFASPYRVYRDLRVISSIF